MVVVDLHGDKMWLDRFSGHNSSSASVPTPQIRSYSPSPRRPIHLGPGAAGRPSLSQRSSALYLASKSNLSTASVNSTRAPNGSALKNEITAPGEFPDPLKILAEVVGHPLPEQPTRETTRDDNDEAERPSTLIEDVDFEGLSLQEFSQVDFSTREDEQWDLGFSIQTATEYEREIDKLEDLHQSILACDDVLKSVEASLTTFQKDLGAVSAEIETLQSRSTALNTKLENRKRVEQLLGPAVEDISIAPDVIRIISEGPVDQKWVKSLEELERCSKATKDRMKGPDTVRAVSNLQPLLDDLSNKAIERIRNYFVAQIKTLRSPNVNAQIIQQQGFLNFKPLFSFMTTYHPQLAEEIAQAYINTMRWYYSSHFSRYRQALEKLSLHIVDKQDTLGADQTSQKNTAITPGKGSQLSYDPFSIGRRMDILKHISSPALTSYLASEDSQTHYLETPFLHFNLGLISNCAFEYSFIAAFFSPSTSGALSQKLNAIFTPTFTLGDSFTKSLIDSSFDCIGILLAVRITQAFAFELQRRKCPAADSYINGTNMLLWPRFQLAMDMHAESIRRATGSLPSSNRVLSLSASTISASNLQSTAPHQLTQRFGSFLQAVLGLSADAGDDSEPVGRSLERLRVEVEGFLTKAARGLSPGRRERFLGNNYALVLTIVGETKGKLAEQMRAHFEGLKDSVTAG